MHLTGHIIDVWHFMYDSLFGILAFYLADFFSDILFDIHLALRFYVSCSDFSFAVLLIILFDMHGMAFCLTLIPMGPATGACNH